MRNFKVSCLSWWGALWLLDKYFLSCPLDTCQTAQGRMASIEGIWTQYHVPNTSIHEADKVLAVHLHVMDGGKYRKIFRFSKGLLWVTQQWVWWELWFARGSRCEQVSDVTSLSFNWEFLQSYIWKTQETQSWFSICLFEWMVPLGDIWLRDLLSTIHQ